MDFPSASTFGLLPNRRTAISLPMEVAGEFVAEQDLDIDLDELSELLDWEADGEATLEIVFEPWDDELGADVIGEVDDEDDEDDEGDDGAP